MKSLFRLAVIAILSLVPLYAQAEEGGVKDSSGLVWGATVNEITGGSFSTHDWAWDQIDSFVGNFDGSGIDYDDWRLPTPQELLDAHADGVLEQSVAINGGLPASNGMVLWTSETRGKNSAYGVYFDVEYTYNADGEIFGFYLINPTVDVYLQSSLVDAVMVRGGAPAGDGGGSGGGSNKGRKK